MPQIKKSLLDSIKSILIILPIAFLIRTFIYGLYQVPTGSMENTMLVGESFIANKFIAWQGNLNRGDIIAFNDYWHFKYSSNPLMKIFQMYVWGPDNWTKRIIALPGDHIQGVLEDGKPIVYLNGQKLNEPYINQYPLIITHVPGCAVSNLKAYVYRTYDPSVPLSEQPFYVLKQENIALANRVYTSLHAPTMLEPNTPAPATSASKTADEYDVYLKDNEYWVMGDNRLNSSDSRFNGPLPAQYIHAKIVFRLWSIDPIESWWLVDLIKHPIDFWSRVRWRRFFQKM